MRVLRLKYAKKLPLFCYLTIRLHFQNFPASKEGALFLQCFGLRIA